MVVALKTERVEAMVTGSATDSVDAMMVALETERVEAKVTG